MKIAFIKIFNDGDKRTRSQAITYDYLKASIATKFSGIEYKICYSVDEIKKFNPNIVGFSTATESFMRTKQLIKEVRKVLPNSFIILGGPHITALPETLPKECNIGVIGEGEMAILEILNHYKNDSYLIQSIKGIAWWDLHKSLVINPEREMTPLDDLPIPTPIVQQFGNIAVITTRGCVNKCIHCSEHVIWKTYREMSAKKLADILE